MIFLESFLWGTGLSLGMCVGLVAWAYLRPYVTRYRGSAESMESFNEQTLKSLVKRNRLTRDTNEFLARIARAMEPEIDVKADSDGTDGSGLDISE